MSVIEHGIEFAVGAALLGFNGHHAGFYIGTSAQTPGGVDDFRGKRLFDCAFGREVCLEGGAEIRVEVVLLGADEIAAGVESEGDGVTGGARFPGSTDRTCRGLRIHAIGCDLGIS